MTVSVRPGLPYKGVETIARDLVNRVFERILTKEGLPEKRSQTATTAIEAYWKANDEMDPLLRVEKHARPRLLFETVLRALDLFLTEKIIDNSQKIIQKMKV